MAYVSQEMKKQLAPQIKAVLKKYGMKGTIAVSNHSKLVVNLKEGKLDLIGQANLDNKARAERTGDRFFEIEGNYQANPYSAHNSGNVIIAKFFKDLVAAMNGVGSDIGNYDNSDVMTDYFDVGWYIGINVGDYGKPYICTGMPLDGMLNGRPLEDYTFA